MVQGPSEPAIEATLIGGQYSSDRQLYPRFSFVFVDAGTAGGLKAGQNLSVFANLKSRNSKTVVENRNRLVGHVKIIKTSENFSTGFVTEAFEELQMGDHVGGGATQSATEKKNPIEDSNMALEDTPDNAPEKPAEGSPDGGVEDSNSLEL